jgi:ABC-type amino acid transport substrate-binding protein
MVFWTVFGMLMVAFVTSTITTTMTMEKLAGHIAGPEDLPGKAIGVLAGGLSEDYAIENHLDSTTYSNLGDAVKALVAGNIQAIVDDASELQYYDKSHPELPITEVGPLFERHDYGFALAKDSPLRHPINQTLVLLNERGFMAKIGNEYFGNMYRP